jgi:MATE family multidrug resistance protein
MVMGFLGLLVNIPINYIFIYGHFGMPELGGVGCGVATASVYWVMFVAMLSYVKRAGPCVIFAMKRILANRIWAF